MSAPRSFTFLVNPNSGGGAAPEAVVPVARLLRDAGASVDVTYSPGPRATDALVLAAVERGDVVVSVGGDGMVSHLAGAVSEAGGTLGVLPAGRGNDFARMLGLPSEPAAIAEHLLHTPCARSTCSSLDPARRPEPAGRGIGLLRHRRPRRGHGRQDAVDPAEAAVPRSPRCAPSPPTSPDASGSASTDDAQEYAAALVVVAGSAYYGKGMKVAPGAIVDDGLLDVIVVEAASRTALVRSFPKIYDGSHVDLPEVTCLRGARIELNADGRTPLRSAATASRSASCPALGAAPAVVQVRPGALRVIG